MCVQSSPQCVHNLVGLSPIPTPSLEYRHGEEQVLKHLHLNPRPDRVADTIITSPSRGPLRLPDIYERPRELLRSTFTQLPRYVST